MLKDVEGTEPTTVRRRHGADQSANATGYTFTKMRLRCVKSCFVI